MLGFRLRFVESGLSGNSDGFSLDADEGALTIGRGAAANVQLALPDLADIELILIGRGTRVQVIRPLKGKVGVFLGTSKRPLESEGFLHVDDSLVIGPFKLQLGPKPVLNESDKRFLQEARCVDCKERGDLPRNPAYSSAAWVCRQCANKRLKAPRDVPRTRLGSYELLRAKATKQFRAYEGLWPSTGILAVVKTDETADGGASNQTHNIEKLRFVRREQRIAQAMSHPHIVQHYETGEYDGVHYSAFEYTGDTNANYFVINKRPLREVLLVARDLFDAIDYLHRVGYAHRDVTLQNVRLRERSRWEAKLSNFALAKSLYGPGQSQLTMGTKLDAASSRAPEQQRSGSLPRPSADLFNAGEVLYAMLAGKMPERNARGEVLESIKTATRYEDLTPQLIEAVDKLIDPDPAFRSKMGRATQIMSALWESIERS